MDWTSDAKRGQGRTGGKIELHQEIQPATAEKTPPPCSSVRTKGRGSGDDDVLRGQSIGPRRSEGEE